ELLADDDAHDRRLRPARLRDGRLHGVLVATDEFVELPSVHPRDYTAVAPGVPPGSNSDGNRSTKVRSIGARDPWNGFGPRIVIVLENWSFDSLYGEFAGADGLSSLFASIAQIDPATGMPYPTLPQEEPYLPTTLPNAPFALNPYLGLGGKTAMDLTQKFYQEQMQIDGGKMDMFVAF